MIALALVALVGGALALYTLWGVRRIEAAHPPIGSFVDAGGVRLHYVDAGAGIPVVLLHGASVNLRDMHASLLPKLADRYRTLAFDRPGYGYSSRDYTTWMDPAAQARCLRAALEELGVERPLLVAHSWAGSLAMAFALESPDALRGVLLISPATHPWPGGVAFYRTLAQLPIAGPILRWTLLFPLARRIADAAVQATLRPNVPPTGYRDNAALDLLFRPAQFRADAQDVSLLCPFLAEQSKRYGEVRVPLTIVTGKTDHIVSPRLHSRALHAQVPGSRLVELDETGHAPHHVHPDLIARELDDLAARTEP